jgi:hypothetical protein
VLSAGDCPVFFVLPVHEGVGLLRVGGAAPPRVMCLQSE